MQNEYLILPIPKICLDLKLDLRRICDVYLNPCFSWRIYIPIRFKSLILSTIRIRDSNHFFLDFAHPRT